MASQLANEHCCVKYCWGVYEENRIVNSVCVDDWTAERAIMPSNATSTIEKVEIFNFTGRKISTYHSFIQQNSVTQYKFPKFCMF